MAEIYVTSTADSGAGSLRQAIADAQDGDVILFDADVFPQGQTTSILLSSQLTVNKSVSIYGGFSDGADGYTSGATKRFYVYRDVEGVKTKVYIDDDNPATEGETVLFENVCRVALDGQGTVRGISIASSSSPDVVVNIAGIAFKSCNGQNGGAAYLTNVCQTTLNDCNFDSCIATANGGVLQSIGTSQNVLNNCSIANCSAATGGAVMAYLASQNTLNNCIIDTCTATNGGGVYSSSTSQNTLNDCTITNCSATSNGGGVCSTNTSQNTLTNCTFDGCSATTYGGGVCSNSTSQNTLTDCTISGCSATNGGGVYSTNTSQNTLTNCTFDGCSATNGGGVYAGSSSICTFTGCTITGNTAISSSGGIYGYTTGALNLNDCAIKNNITSGASKDINVYTDTTATINNSIVGYLRVSNSGNLTINGITLIDNLTLSSNATITIADGAALTLTASASIGAAKFTSDGRGYLATAAGIDTSAATLTNVVLCAYGADVSSFVEVDGVLEWSAANPTTTVLIERADGDSWSTVTQTAGESLTLYLPPSDTVRLFDGVQFFTAQAPSQRTYYYIGGSEGSFTSAADWSLRRGGVAITEPPVVAGQRFIVGDIEDAQEE